MAAAGGLADYQARILGEELARARERGLADLDLPLGSRRQPIRTPLLDWLAASYAKDWDLARSACIGRLLWEALSVWAAAGHQAEARLVRRLFFAPKQAAPEERRPGALLRAALEDSGRSRWSFEKQRRAVLRDFAGFLVGFVTHQPVLPTPLAAVAPPTANAVARRPAVVVDRLRQHPWRLVDSAFVAVALVLTVIMVLHAAGGAGKGDGSRPTPAAVAAQATFRFNDLGGGSTVINVYRGVSDNPADKLANGTFSSGQTTTALCQTTGRTVRSDPSVGEQLRQSDRWVRVLAQPGQVSYASLTYGDIDGDALAALPDC